MESKHSVVEIYHEVLAGVINSLGDLVEEGMDRDIIDELKSNWESKVRSSNAVHIPSIPDSSINPFQINQLQINSLGINAFQNIPPQTNSDNKLHPVKIVLPAYPDSANQKVVLVNVPIYALKNKKLYGVLTAPLINATLNLTQQLAGNLLQEHMNAAFNGNEKVIDTTEDQPQPSTSGLNQNHYGGPQNPHKRKGARDGDKEEKTYLAKKKKTQ